MAFLRKLLGGFLVNDNDDEMLHRQTHEAGLSDEMSVFKQELTENIQKLRELQEKWGKYHHYLCGHHGRVHTHPYDPQPHATLMHFFQQTLDKLTTYFLDLFEPTSEQINDLFCEVYQLIAEKQTSLNNLLQEIDNLEDEKRITNLLQFADDLRALAFIQKGLLAAIQEKIIQGYKQSEGVAKAVEDVLEMGEQVFFGVKIPLFEQEEETDLQVGNKLENAIAAPYQPILDSIMTTFDIVAIVDRKIQAYIYLISTPPVARAPSSQLFGQKTPIDNPTPQTVIDNQAEITPKTP